MHLGKAPRQRCFGIRFTAHKRIHIKEKTSDHRAHVKPVANVKNLSDMKSIYVVKKKARFTYLSYENIFVELL